MVESTGGSDSMYGKSSLQLKKETGDRFYYILMALAIFALIGGIVLVGGMLRMTLAIIILIIIGFNLIYWSVEKTENSNIWRSEDEFDEEVNLKLRENSDLVKRAFKGMELSQSMLEKKISNLFLSKLKVVRSLSQKEVSELLKNPDDFRQVVDDEVISNFVLANKGKHEMEDDKEFEQGSMEMLKEEDYEQWISKLLNRIEGWE